MGIDLKLRGILERSSGLIGVCCMSGGGPFELFDDKTPQLGGPLDCLGEGITSNNAPNVFILSYAQIMGADNPSLFAGFGYRGSIPGFIHYATDNLAILLEDDTKTLTIISEPVFVLHTVATFKEGLIRFYEPFQLLSGSAIVEFSIDGTLAGDSDFAVPTEKAVKTYHDNNPPININHDALINVTTSQHHVKAVSADMNLNDLNEKDHISLANVTTSQHHVKAVSADINLNDLNEKDHSSLDDVTANQHHAPTVAGDLNLNDLAEKDHISLANVTSDQHHDKQHPMDDALEHTSSDVATLNSSISKHGFLKKLSNDDTEYMDGEGNWTVPPGGALPTIFPPSTIGGDSGFTKSLADWIAPRADVNARIQANIVCPETRADWKIYIVGIISGTPGADIINGELSVGESADGGAVSINNKLNAVNADFDFPGINIVDYLVSSEISLTKGNIIRVRWQKTAADGTGTLFILNLWLGHD